MNTKEELLLTVQFLSRTLGTADVYRTFDVMSRAFENPAKISTCSSALRSLEKEGEITVCRPGHAMATWTVSAVNPGKVGK